MMSPIVGRSEPLPIGVAIPAFNAERFIEAAVRSVVAQDCGPRVAVVDDGSTDGTWSTLERLASETDIRIARQANGGAAAARRAALDLLEPCVELVLFFDADDVMHAGMLRSLATLLAQRPEAGVAYCDFARIDHVGAPVDPLSVAGGRPGPTETSFLSILQEATVIPSVSLIRRSVYDRTPGWDAGFGQPFEDMNLMLNLALQAPVLHDPTVRVAYRSHPAQSTASAQHLETQRQKLHARWRAPQAHLSQEQQRIVDEAYAAFDLEVARKAPASAWRHLRARRPTVAARVLAGAVPLAAHAARRRRQLRERSA